MSKGLLTTVGLSFIILSFILMAIDDRVTSVKNQEQVKQPCNCDCPIKPRETNDRITT